MRTDLIFLGITMLSSNPTTTQAFSNGIFNNRLDAKISHTTSAHHPKALYFDNRLNQCRSTTLLSHANPSDPDDSEPAVLDHFRHYFSLHNPDLKNGRSNHIPMVISAMCSLGATHGEVIKFINEYRDNLLPIQAQDPIPAEKIDQYLGDKNSYDGFRHTFAQQQEQLGTVGLINEVLPYLAGGICSSAFHALIRLAYGFNNNDDNEVINALAYMASSYQSLGEIDRHHQERYDHHSFDSFQEVLNWLSSHPTLSTGKVTANSIFSRLEKVTQLEGYNQLRTAIAACPIDLPTLHSAALSIFLHSPSFTSLHLVTSTHAVSLLTDHLENPQIVLDYLGLAIANAYIANGSPPLNQTHQIDAYLKHHDLPSWQLLTEKALNSNSIDIQHNTKMVRSCHDLFNSTGQLKYLLAATVWVEHRIPWKQDNDCHKAA